MAPVIKTPLMKLRVVPPIEQSWSIKQIVRERTPSGWERVFQEAKPELDELSDDLDRFEKEGGQYYPLKKDLFRAFELTPLHRVRVVIIGQDPYPQVNPSNGQPRAVGLSFSVARSDTIPSSLQNIFQELKNTVDDFVVPRHGDLTNWARQGVLLLNACLTVFPNQPGSHGDIWKGFVIKVLGAIANQRPGTIYILWGNNAAAYQGYLGDRAIILTAAHPSGRSATKGFFGCNHFNEVNKRLVKRGEPPINWNLD